MCKNFNDILTYVPVFNFKYCESVVLYIILLEVDRELSRFCIIARRSKVVGHAALSYSKNFCILCSVLNRCWDFTPKL